MLSDGPFNSRTAPAAVVPNSKIDDSGKEPELHLKYQCQQETVMLSNH